MTAPCYPAWLAITGRALLTLGRMFAIRPIDGGSPWLETHLLQASVGRCEPTASSALTAYAAPFQWLCGQLRQLKQHPEAAAAVALPAEMLQELAQLAYDLTPTFAYLLELCAALRSSFGPSRAMEVAVLQGFVQGCAEGWLHEGLQQLGSKVWVAWPQKFACNDDRCLEMSGLAEQLCSRQCCSGCRVSDCVGRPFLARLEVVQLGHPVA